MIRVGLVGIGFMGWIHYLAYRRVRGLKLGAVVSRDAKKRSGDWRGIQGNFGPPGEQVDLTGVRAYTELEELLADPKIDLVDVCLPPYLHADVAQRALASGKHVFCEKPIALGVAEARRMVAAAERHRRQLLIGHVLPYFPEYAFALAAARSGRYGRALGGHFKRVISDPLWLPDFYDPHRVGGPLVDLHIHDAHFIRLVWGQPSRVFSRGSFRGEVVERATTQFLFDDPAVVVSATSGVIGQQGRPFTHGFELYFERATLQFELAVLAGEPVRALPLTVYRHDGRVETPTLAGGDEVGTFAAELAEVARALRAGKPSPTLSGELARDALALCQAQTQSVRSGRPTAVK